MNNHPSRASNYAIARTAPGSSGYLSATGKFAFGDLNDAIIYPTRAAAEAACKVEDDRWDGWRLRVVAVAYQAEVYHGGQHRGLGKWASGRCYADRDHAIADGDRLARQARQVVGGDPIVEIEVVARR